MIFGTTFADPGLAQDLIYALQIAVGGVFLLSVLPKLRRPAVVRATVTRYEMLPDWAAPAAAVALIVVEAFLAGAFLSGELVWLALPVSFATLVAFAIATAVNLRRGRNIECGCFGRDDEVISGRSLARIASLLAAVSLMAGAMASGGAHAITVGWVAARGWSGVGYAGEILALGVAIATLLTWALTSADLLALVRSRRQTANAQIGLPEHLSLEAIEA